MPQSPDSITDMAKKKSPPSKTSHKSFRVSKKTKTSKKPASQKIIFKNLGMWNIALAVLLAVQAAVVIVLSKSASLPITNHYLATDALASQAAGHNVLAPAVHHLFDLNIKYVTAAVLLVSAAAYGAAATIHRKMYEAGLKQRINQIRWIDFSISASFMMAIIALINGISDELTLVLITALVVLLHGLAYLMELQNKESGKVNWLHFWGILIAGAAVWLTIVSQVKGTIIYGMTNMPTFVYWIDGSIFLILLGMAANIFLTFRGKGRWTDYLFAERVYMVLGFAVQTALAWQIFFGMLR